MKIVLTGNQGMLGSEISNQLKTNDVRFIGYSKSDLDITKPSDVLSAIPADTNLVINCAAYTNVAAAENDPRAFEVNAIGPAVLAEHCNKFGISIIHFSTDYVFDGKSKIPYIETDQTNPLNGYGKSKLQGEINIQEICQTPFYVLRTSWLYGEHGSCFPKNIFHRYQSGEELRVVDDQTGTPTNTSELARLTLKLIERSGQVESGVYHAVNSGQASWYEFAETIFESLELKVPITRVSTQDLPGSLKRPSFSVLDNSKMSEVLGIEIPHWRDSLSNSRIQEWIR